MKTEKRAFRRTAGFLLALVLVIGMIPGSIFTALAEGEEAGGGSQEPELTETVSGSKLLNLGTDGSLPGGFDPNDTSNPYGAALQRWLDNSRAATTKHSQP